MSTSPWAIGVDLGATKIEAAIVDADGEIQHRSRHMTAVEKGPDGVRKQIVEAVHELLPHAEGAPAGVGIGVAGQISASSGIVRFGPNLRWRDVPLQSDLQHELDMPVVVVNDVRAATVGEWKHGAGKGLDDLVCIFVGTGIGGGVISGGRLLTGCSNIAGEVGHMTVDLNGPLCHCGNRGCLEAIAAGWAIARDAREAVGANARRGATLLEMADHDTGKITTKLVARAAHDGDPLAEELVDNASRALAAGMVGIVNAFNPERLILGGGVIEGIPEFVGRVDEEVRQRALNAATEPLSVVPAALHDDSGVIGAAALARRHGSDH